MNNQIEDVVFEQYDEIRRAGVCNRFDRGCVQKFASLWDMKELEIIINDGNYLRMLRSYRDWNLKILQAL